MTDGLIGWILEYLVFCTVTAVRTGMYLRVKVYEKVLSHRIAFTKEAILWGLK